MFIYGYPCSGKTTLGVELKEILNDEIEHLDGDIIRKTTNRKLGFSKDDRIENHKRILEKVVESYKEKSTIISMILPYKQSRKLNRKTLEDNYIQVYLDCPVSECERRDVKGMYKKARFKEIKNFTGVDGDFEFSDNNDIVVNTNYLDISLCIDQILEFLMNKKFIMKKSATV